MNWKNIKYRTVDTLRRWGVIKNYIRESHPLIEPYLKGQHENVEFSEGLEWGEVGVPTRHPKEPWYYWVRKEANHVAPLTLSTKWTGTEYELDVYMSNKLYESPCYVEVDVQVNPGKNMWFAPLWGWGNSVPPEYDCAEMYSDDNGRYSVQSNYHYGEGYAHDGKPHASVKARKHAFFYGKRNVYGTLFDERGITYFINRHPVRHLRMEDVDYNISSAWNVIVSAGMKKEALFTKEGIDGILWSAKVYKRFD